MTLHRSATLHRAIIRELHVHRVLQTNLPSVFVPSELDPNIDLLKYKKIAADLFGAHSFYIHPAQFNHQLPQGGMPEFAFVGRSNVGKSSLIGRLLGNKGLVRVSKAPGCTKNINFFGFSGSADGKTNHLAYLVDLPGYGFAKRSKQERIAWNGIISNYLMTRDQSTLRRVFILIDARHGLRENDLEIMSNLNDSFTPYQIVFTKSDLIKENELFRSLQSTVEIVMAPQFSGTCVPYIHVLSSASGAGIHGLQLCIAEIYNAKWAR